MGTMHCRNENKTESVWKVWRHQRCKIHHLVIEINQTHFIKLLECSICTISNPFSHGKFSNWKKSEDMRDQRYLNEFKNAVQALRYSGIVMNVSEIVVKKVHITWRNNQLINIWIRRRSIKQIYSIWLCEVNELQ